MVIIEEGISTKSFVISMVSAVLFFISLVISLQVTKQHNTLLVNVVCLAISLPLLGVSLAAWFGLFDKKVPKPTLEPEPPVAEEPEPEVKPKAREDGVQEWVKKWKEQ